MNNQKRIIGIFKQFIEKIFVPQIRKVDGNLQEWYQFSSMMSLEYPNMTEIQNFVERIPELGLLPTFQKKRSDTSGKKKDQNQLLFAEDSEKSAKNAFNPNKTYVSDRSKNTLPYNRGFEVQQTKEVKAQGREGTYVKDQQFKKITLNTMANISKSSSSNSIVTSLNRLYLNLLENQKKIDSLLPNVSDNRI